MCDHLHLRWGGVAVRPTAGIDQLPGSVPDRAVDVVPWHLTGFSFRIMKILFCITENMMT